MIQKLIAFALLAFVNLGFSQQNFDFESVTPGTYSAIPGWTIGMATYTAMNTNGLCANYPISGVSNVTVVQAPTITGIQQPSLLPASPFQGNRVVFLNSAITNTTALVRISQAFTVTPQNKILQYAYFAWDYAGDHLNCCSNHYFKIEVVDCVNAPVPCSSVAVTATTQACPNTGTLGMITGTNNNIYTPNWIVRTVDLSSYVGSCVTLKAEVGTCVYLGHTQQMYLDAMIGPSLIQNLPNGPLCNQNSATLTSQPAVSYTWSGPNGFSSNNQTVITTTAGVYSLTTSNYGCGNPTQTVNLVFANTPTVNAAANSTTICSGSSATLSASGNGINTYSWSTGATSASIVVSPTVSSSYTVTANSGTCPATATVSLNVVNCTSMQEVIVNDVDFSVFPNPSNRTVHIQASSNLRVEVCDQLGRTIFSDFLDQENQFQFKIDLVPGVYFIAGGSKVKRIVVLE